MTIRVMSSGKGYEYLLKSVVVGDGDREMSSPLTRYYTESGCPPGTWVGTGLMSLDDGRSAALAEGDTVTEEHLARLLGEGIHPVTGEKLGKRFPSLQPPRERIAARVARLDPDLRGEARAEAVERIREEQVAKKSRTAVAGFDLTFSPPKSVSAIWGVADAGTQALIAQAHHAAMRDTIALLEERVAATRVGAGGIAQMPIVGVIATAFDHYDSRAADPQLHTHVVVSNKVQGQDGRWRSLDSRRLHRATVALSASYNAFLTDHTARLLGVTWVPVDRGKDRNTGWEIEGVPAALIAAFSRRTTGGSDSGEGIKQVKNRLIERYVAEHGRQPSAATIAKLRQQATLETRPGKELHSLADLTADWRARAGVVLGEDAPTWAQHLLDRGATEARLRADDLGLEQVEDLASVVLMSVANRRATWGRFNLHAAKVGAKVVLIGDWAQLSAVEVGGAFGMLVRHRQSVPELTDVRRFANDWEKTASLGLRHGRTDALDEYQERGRLLDGDAETMLDAIYEAWRSDRDEGLRTLMIAGTGEMVAQLNERARADLVEAVQVEADGLRLHDGTTAGVGDLVVTRLNDRRLSTGRAWVKNGDRWQVTHRYDDGSLAVRRLGRGDQPHGKALVLPAKYVREEVELGYASTVHRAQGASVDTAHALVDPEASSRELFYVAMTRGKHRNHAYVTVPDPHEVEPHLDQPKPLTPIDRLAKVLARSDADLSATETLTLEVDRHASLSTLLAEYDVLAREAQTDRWAALLDVAPFPENVADDVFTSPYFEHLESALARHEAAGHLAAVALTALAPRLTPGEDQADPAAQLADMLDQATQKLRPGKGTRVRVAGLIPTPAEPIADDMQTALTERQALIEAAARGLLHDAQESGAAWVTKLGQPGSRPEARERWEAHATTVALYRYRYDISGPAPLGDPHAVRSPDQAAEYRVGQLALRQIKMSVRHEDEGASQPTVRSTPRRGL